MADIRIIPALGAINVTGSADFRGTGASSVLFVSGSGNVGIGTSTPGSKLHVAGAIKATALTGHMFGDGTDTTRAISILDSNLSQGSTRVVTLGRSNSNNNQAEIGFYLDQTGSAANRLSLGLYNSSDTLNVLGSGKVGVGTINPKQRLDVAGAGGKIAITNTGTSNYSEVIFYEGSTVKADIWVNGSTQTDYAGANSMNIWQGSNAPMAFYTNGGSNERMRITANGNLGVGTSNPGEKLHVYGNVRAESGASTTGTDRNSGYLLWSDDAFGMQLHHNGTNWGTNVFARSYDSDVRLGHYNTGVTAQNQFTSSLTVKYTRNIQFNDYGSGTHTGSAAYRLAVDSSGNIIEESLGAGAVDGLGSSNYIARWEDTDTLTSSSIYQDANGNIGVGTTSPLGKWDVVGTGTQLDSTGYYYSTRIKDTTNSGVLLGGNNTANGVGFIAGINQLAFLTYNSGWGERMRIAANGNVGIGVTTPLQKVHVSGQRLLVEADNAGVMFRTGGTNRYSVASTGGAFQIYDEVNGLNRFYITSVGNIGIGLTTPSAKVDIYQSGSTAFNVAGSQGQLFSVTDELSGSLMSVNDISGIPILEVFSDDRVVAGQFGTNALVVNGSSVGIGLANPAYRLDVTGSIHVQSGATGTIYFGNDAGNYLSYYNTDAYFKVAGKLYFEDSGFYKGAWDGDGNLGVGTTAPVSLLDIYRSGNTTKTDITIRGGDYGFRLNKTPQSADYAHLRPLNSGNPAVFRVMANGTSANAYVEIWSTDYEADSTNYSRGLFYTDTSGHVYLRGDADGTGAAGNLYLGTDGATQAITVLNGGNVGVGTTSPGAKLEVYSSGTTYATIKAGGGTYAYLRLNTPSSGDGYLIKNIATGNSALNKSLYLWNDPGPIQLVPDGTIANAVTVATDGNLGVGTSSPGGKLDVQQSSTGNLLARVWNTNESGTGSTSIRIANSGNNNDGARLEFTDKDYFVATISGDRTQGMVFRTSATGASPTGIDEQMRITTDGNVGIGLTNPGYKLEVAAPTIKPTADLLLGEAAYGTSTNYVGLKTAFQAGSNDYMILSGKSDGATYVSAKDGEGVYIRGGGNLSSNQIFVPDSNYINIDTATLNVNGAIAIDNSATIGGNLTVDGIITAKEFHTTFVSASIIYQSGSTQFGNSNDDTHDFTGFAHITGDGWEDNTVGSNLLRLESTDTVGAGLTMKNTSGDSWSIYNGDTASWAGRGILGFVYHPSGSAATGPKIVVNTDGNVGIGITNPSYKLYVNGPARASILHLPDGGDIAWNGGYAANNPVFASNGNEMRMYPNGASSGLHFALSNTRGYFAGNLGVGISSPAAKLHISGAGADGQEVLRIDSSGDVANGGYHWMSSAMAGSQSTDANIVHLIGVAESTKNSGYLGFYYAGAGSDSNYLSLGGYAANNLMVIKMNGNVGIGTTNPESKLQVYENANSGLISRVTNVNTGTSAYVEHIVETGTSGREMRLGVSHNYNSTEWNNAWIYAVDRDLALKTNSGAVKTYSGGTAEANVITTVNGNGLGIGDVPASNEKLVVDTPNGKWGLLMSSGSTNYGGLHTNDGVLTLQTGNATAINLASTNVGIGSTAPAAKLDVNGFAIFNADINVQDAVAIYNYSPTNGNAAGSELVFRGQGQTGGVTRSSYWRQRVELDSAYGNSGFSIAKNYDGAGYVEYVRINSAGNIGIGRTNPTALLHVSKSMNAAWLVSFENQSDSGHGLSIVAGGTTGTRYITQWRDAALNERFHMQDTGEVYMPDIGTGTDNSVVVLNSSGYLKTDEIDSRVWGSTLVDGSGTANKVTKWSDSDTLTDSTIYDNGSVHINGTNPLYTLDVNGTFGVGGGTNSSNTYMYDAYNSAASAYFHQPKASIRLDNGATGSVHTAPVSLFLHNENGTDDTWVKLSMGSREVNGGGNTVSLAGIAAQKVSGTSGNWARGNLHLWTKNNATMVDAMTIKYDGNVGIGTSSPTTKLDVNGNIRVDDEVQFTRGGGDYSNYIRSQNYPSEGYTSSTAKYWLEYGAKGGHHFVVNTDGGSGSAENDYDDFTIWQGQVDGDRLFEVRNTGNAYIAGSVGIGTTSSSYKLTVQGASNGINLAGTGAFLRWNSGDIQISNEGSYKMGFYTYNTTAAALVNRMVIDTAGNVGIGTTIPSAKLEVYQSGSTALNIAGSQGQLFSVTDSLSGSLMSVNDISGIPILEVFSDDRVVAGQYGTNALVVNGASVGVGTSAPVLPLHVRGQARIGSNGNQLAHAALQVSAGEGGATLYRDIDIKGAWSSNEGHAITATHSSTTSNIVGQMVFEYNSPGSRIKWGRLYHSGDQSTYPMQLVSNGSDANLGIGTAAPTTPLRVQGGAAMTGGWNKNTTLAATYPVLLLNSNESKWAGIGYDHSVDGIRIWTNATSDDVNGTGSERVSIIAGNVGIGSGTPGYRLTVDNDDANTNNPALYVRNPNSSTAAVIAEFVGDSDSVQIKNVGVGDYVIYNTQQSNGIALYDGVGGVEIHYAGSTVLEADSNGGIKVTGQLSATADVIAYSSDERLKENIKPIENAVDKVKQLNGVTFDWNDKSEELGFEPSTKLNDVGVIAQEVEKIFPQLVHLAPFDIGSDEEGNTISKSGEDYKTVNYSRLTPVLIEAIKEQQVTVETQQKEIDQLKSELKAIRDMLLNQKL